MNCKTTPTPPFAIGIYHLRQMPIGDCDIVTFFDSFVSGRNLQLLNLSLTIRDKIYLQQFSRFRFIRPPDKGGHREVTEVAYHFISAIRECYPKNRIVLP